MISAEWANAGGYSDHALAACNHRIVVYQQKCIEPLCESKSDYQIFSLTLPKDWGLRKSTPKATPRKTGLRRCSDASDLPKYISFEEFKKKGYFVVPHAGELQADTSPTLVL